MNGIASVQELLFHVSSRQIRPHVLSRWRWDRRRDATNMRTLLRNRISVPRLVAPARAIRPLAGCFSRSPSWSGCRLHLHTHTDIYFSLHQKASPPAQNTKSLSSGMCGFIHRLQCASALKSGCKEKKKKKKTPSKIVQVSVAWF